MYDEYALIFNICVYFHHRGNSAVDEAANVLLKLQQAYNDRKYKRLYGKDDTNTSKKPSASEETKPKKSPTKKARSQSKKRLKSPRKAVKSRKSASPRKPVRQAPVRRSPRKAVRTKHGIFTLLQWIL